MEVLLLLDDLKPFKTLSRRLNGNYLLKEWTKGQHITQDTEENILED